MHALFSWLAAHWGILAPPVALILSTIVTALTKYPAGSVENEAAAVFRFLMIIMDRFSLLPHKDTDSHLMLGLNVPGMRSRKPDGLPIDEPTIPSSPAVLVLAGLAVAALLSSCCVFKGSCKNDPVRTCTISESQQQFPHLLPLIADIFLHGGIDVDVVAELGKEGITVAADILKCIVQAIQDGSGAQLAQLKSSAIPGWTANTPSVFRIPVDQVQKLHEVSTRWLKKHS